MMVILTALVLAIIFGLLLILAWTDHKYYLLPNVYNLALLISFGIFHWLTGWAFTAPMNAVMGLLAGGGFLLAIRAAANKIMQADTIGLGDVKFMMAAGFGLGIPNVFMVLCAGSFLGMLHGVILYLAAKRKSAKGAPDLAHVNVPAGVGLCIATAAICIYQFNGWGTIL